MSNANFHFDGFHFNDFNLSLKILNCLIIISPSGGTEKNRPRLASALYLSFIYFLTLRIKYIIPEKPGSYPGLSLSYGTHMSM